MANETTFAADFDAMSPTTVYPPLSEIIEIYDGTTDREMMESSYVYWIRHIIGKSALGQCQSI